MTTPTFKEGLEDVVAGTSSICFLDGRAGRLLYYGYDVHDLAREATFEEVVYLLWHGELPTRSQLSTLQTLRIRSAVILFDDAPKPFREVAHCGIRQRNGPWISSGGSESGSSGRC